jgi:nucleoside-diphosphate-sugar epimerase
MNKLLILGVNGFIGHHLSEAVLRETDWHVYGMDLESDRVAHAACASALSLLRGRHHDQQASGSNTTSENATCCCRSWQSRRPATYISDPLRVFELDFEANLPLIRSA